MNILFRVSDQTYLSGNGSLSKILIKKKLNIKHKKPNHTHTHTQTNTKPNQNKKPLQSTGNAAKI